MDVHLTTAQILAYVGVVVGNGVLAAIVAQVVKKSARLKNKPIIHIMVGVFNTLGSIAQYVLMFRDLPLVAALPGALSNWGVSQAAYRGFIKFFAQENADAAALDKTNTASTTINIPEAAITAAASTLTAAATTNVAPAAPVSTSSLPSVDI